MTETEEVWLEDVTGDGRDDLICRAPTSLTGNECAIFVAHSNGINFDGWDFASYNTGITLDDQILFGDIDADEKTDLICRRAAPQSDAGYIYTAMSNGTGFVFWCYQSSTKVLNPGDEIMLGDVNGDLKDDIIAAAPLAAAAAALLNAEEIFPGIFPNSSATF